MVSSLRGSPVLAGDSAPRSSMDSLRLLKIGSHPRSESGSDVSSWSRQQVAFLVAITRRSGITCAQVLHLGFLARGIDSCRNVRESRLSRMLQPRSDRSPGRSSSSCCPFNAGRLRMLKVGESNSGHPSTSKAVAGYQTARHLSLYARHTHRSGAGTRMASARRPCN